MAISGLSPLFRELMHYFYQMQVTLIKDFVLRPWIYQGPQF